MSAIAVRPMLLLGALGFLCAHFWVVFTNWGVVWDAITLGNGPVWWAWATFLVANLLLTVDTLLFRTDK